MPSAPSVRDVQCVAVCLILLVLCCDASPVGPPPSTTGPPRASSTGSTCILCDEQATSSSSPSSSSSTGSGRVVGDPVFSGLRGQQYQVHGIDGEVYNLISDASVQLNSLFTFLSGPRPCPILPSTGQQSAACFTHDGSYLGNLALRTNADDRLLVEGGDASSGFASVELNGQQLGVGDQAPLHFVDYPTGLVHRISTHELSIVASLYKIDVDNSDAFVNLRSLAILDGQWAALKRAAPHGLLGQTWKVKGPSESVIDGRVDDYVIGDEDEFGTSFVYNKFARHDKMWTDD